MPYNRLIKKLSDRTYFNLLILTLISIALNGYYFGKGDHSVYIPLLKKLINPNLYPQDLIMARPYYYTFFFTLFKPIAQIFSIEALFFLLFFFTKFFTFLMIFKLSMLLFENENASYLAALFFLFPQMSLASRSFHAWFILSDFAFPFILFSIYLFLKKRHILAFVLAGIVFNINGMYSTFVFLIFIFYFVIHKIEFKTIIQSAIAFILSASPLLLWRFTTSTDSLFYANPQWLDILKIRAPFHIFPFSWNILLWLNFSLTVILFIISLKNKPKRHDEVLIFIYAIVLLCVIGTIFVELIPLPVIVSMMLFRSTMFFTVFSFIYFANYIVSIEKSLSKVSLVFLTFFVFAMIFSFPVKCGIYERSTGDEMCEFLSYNYHTRPTAWRDIQIWSKLNTENELFITPPYIEAFRVESERSIVGSWKDGTFSLFSSEFSFIWWERMTDLRCIYKKCNEYNSLTKDDFKKIADKYNATYVVVEKPKELDLTLLYENDKFALYSI